MLPSGRIGVTGITTTVARASFSRAVVASSSAIDPPEDGEAARSHSHPRRAARRAWEPGARGPGLRSAVTGSAGQVPAGQARGRRAPGDDVLVDLVVA